MTATARVEGLGRFRESVRAAADKLADLQTPAKAAAAAMEDYATANAPVDSGELAGSFGTRTAESGAILTAGAPHAVFVNFGTRHMPAQPFMPPDPAAIAVPIYADHLEAVVATIEGR